MGILQFLSFLLFLIPLIYAAEDCPNSMCGGNSDVLIRFPFRLDSILPLNCGYPGFKLRCTIQGLTVLNLPYSGEFYVSEISYLTQKIKIYDPDNCLPRRLLQFNITDSPFTTSFYQNFTFLSCPVEFTKSRFTPIDCLSNSTTSVLATSSLRFAKSVSSSCNIISTLPVPIHWPNEYIEGFTSEFNDEELQLEWHSPDCQACESQGGVCGLTGNTSKHIGCLHPQTARSSTGLRVFRIICLSISVPAVICAIGIACFACFMDSRRRRVAVATTHVNVAPSSVIPRPIVFTMGLDDLTIESYTKLVLGESKRLPGPNDITCPICLSDYCTKDTIRCIPECKHCFHADCIDEWLRMNGTCPVCRNSPFPSPACDTLYIV